MTKEFCLFSHAMNNKAPTPAMYGSSLGELDLLTGAKSSQNTIRLIPDTALK